MISSIIKQLGYTSTELSIVDSNDWPMTSRLVTGDAVSQHTAMSLSAVWACVALIAGTTATLPLKVYKQNSSTNVMEPAYDHHLFNLLHRSPNYEQTSVDFWEYMAAGVELSGNAYAVKERGGMNRVVALNPIDPGVVMLRRADSGGIEYRWSEKGKSIVKTDEDILHIRGAFPTPLGGRSTLDSCRSTFNTAIDTNNAAAATFKNGARPSGVLSLDRPLKADQRAETEQLLTKKFVGAMNDGRPMLLDNGLQWQSISLNPEDAQMLETRRFSVEEICRIFGVPPFMIGHTETSTSWGSGLEQQVLAFQKFTLRRRLKRIEMSLEKQLLTPAEISAGYYIRFDIEGLLRADTKARADYYKAGLNDGWLNVNQVTAWENLPPVPGGDINRVQMQNVPLTEANGNQNGDNGNV